MVTQCPMSDLPSLRVNASFCGQQQSFWGFFFKEKKHCAIFNRLHFPGEAVAFHAHSHTQTT